MQRELFQELENKSSKPTKLGPVIFPGRFVRFRVAYEDLIFGCLTLVLLLLAGFCLGVERGKRLVPTALSSKPVQMAAVETDLLPLPVLPTRAQVSPNPSAALPLVTPVVANGNFAIQLASYVTIRPAEKEVEQLRRQGFRAQVIEQGRFFELRVSGFRSKNEAATALVRFRKTYRDAFIKQISSRKAMVKRQA